MTRPACALIIRIGTLFLSWRSLKSLRSADPISGHHCPILKSNDVEILQLWTLLTFHSIYTLLNIEVFLSSVIPFYYYFKMIICLVTFIPHTKFPNFWFEVIIIPAIDRVHSLLSNFDAITWARVEIQALPWTMLDIVLPGVIFDHRRVRRERKSALRECREDHLLEFDALKEVGRGDSLAHMLFGCHVYVEGEYRRLGVPSKGSDEVEKTKKEDSGAKPNRIPYYLRGIRRIGAKKDDSVSNSSGPSSTSRRRRKGTSEGSGKDGGKKLSSSKPLLKTPRMSNTKSSTPPRPPSSSSSRKPQLKAHRTFQSSKSTHTPLSSLSSSSSSPVAKSRVSASSMQLRKFEREHTSHRPSAAMSKRGARFTPPSKKNSRQGSETTSKGRLRNSATKQIRRRRNPKAGGDNEKENMNSGYDLNSEDVTKDDQVKDETDVGADESEVPQSSPELKSLGETLRVFFTGNSDIRLRDYLFDLDTPNIPSPRPNKSNVENERGNSVEEEEEEGEKEEEKEEMVEGDEAVLESKSSLRSFFSFRSFYGGGGDEGDVDESSKSDIAKSNEGEEDEQDDDLTTSTLTTSLTSRSSSNDNEAATNRTAPRRTRGSKGPPMSAFSFSSSSSSLSASKKAKRSGVNGSSGKASVVKAEERKRSKNGVGKRNDKMDEGDNNVVRSRSRSGAGRSSSSLRSSSSSIRKSNGDVDNNIIRPRRSKRLLTKNKKTITQV